MVVGRKKRLFSLFSTNFQFFCRLIQIWTFFIFMLHLLLSCCGRPTKKKFQKKKKKRLSVKSEKDKKSHPRMRRCWLDGIRSFPEQKSPVLFFFIWDNCRWRVLAKINEIKKRNGKKVPPRRFWVSNQNFLLRQKKSGADFFFYVSFFFSVCNFHQMASKDSSSVWSRCSKAWLFWVTFAPPSRCQQCLAWVYPA